jgi:hypothetical protein
MRNGDKNIMARIIFVPQYPTPMRYQYFWLDMFKDFFKEKFDKVIILGEKYIKGNIDKNFKYTKNFSIIDEAIKFELNQIKEYNNLRLKSDDILFLADLSFPGLFSNILYHKTPNTCYAFCHATSKNFLDYFQINPTSKFKVESAHAKLFDKIFVGSEYHKNKLGWHNISVIGLPTPPNKYISYNNKCIRNNNIISVARITPQKVNLTIESNIQKMLGMKIKRQKNNTWEEYSDFLSESKILFISSKEDTYNYTILDAIKCGCIPVAPRNICFPEILPEWLLYSDKEEAYMIIINILNLIRDNIAITSLQYILDHSDKFFERLEAEIKI